MRSQFRNREFSRKTFLVLFALAVGIRIILIILFWKQNPVIVDEQHYDAIAQNIVTNHEFVNPVGQRSAIRPPLYPALVAAVYAVFGNGNYNAVRIVQSILSLLTGLLLYTYCRAFADARVAATASILLLLYPSLLVFNCLILSEGLFILLFLSVLTLSVYWLKSERTVLLSLAGVFLALASLTRSVAYPLLIPISGTLLLLILPPRRVRLGAIGLFIVLFGVTLAPWALRNYGVFGTFVPVDTMGGLNLYMGNYEYTPLHRPWAAVDIEDNTAWFRGHESELKGMDEATRQKWGMQNGFTFIKNNMALTVRRSVLKVFHMWGLERTVIAALSGQRETIDALARPWLKVVLTLSIVMAYTMLMVAGFTGFLSRLIVERERADILVLVLLVVITGLHSIVFGHSRYHLPFIPFLCAYAAWLVVNSPLLWRQHRRALGVSAIVTGVFFAIVWSYEIFVGSSSQISAFLTAS